MNGFDGLQQSTFRSRHVDYGRRQPESDDSSTDRPIRAGGAVLGSHRHMCNYFHDDDEHYGGLLPFIKDGFERGDHIRELRERRRPMARPDSGS